MHDNNNNDDHYKLKWEGVLFFYATKPQQMELMRWLNQQEHTQLRDDPGGVTVSQTEQSCDSGPVLSS